MQIISDISDWPELLVKAHESLQIISNISDKLKFSMKPHESLQTVWRLKFQLRLMKACKVFEIEFSVKEPLSLQVF